MIDARLRADMRHQHGSSYPDCNHSFHDLCTECDQVVPCETNRLLDALEAAEDKAARFATKLANGARDGNEALSGLARENQRLREGIAALPDRWLHGAWGDTPRKADRIADRMAASQYAGDWLREQVDALLNPAERTE